jgi:hypothetical protein
MSREKADYQQWIKEVTAMAIVRLQPSDVGKRKIIKDCFRVARQDLVYLAQFEKPETIDVFIEHFNLWISNQDSEAYAAYAFSFIVACGKNNTSHLAQARINAISRIQVLSNCDPLIISDFIDLGVCIEGLGEDEKFEATIPHAKSFFQSISGALLELKESVDKKYQTQLFSYAGFMEAMCAKYLPDRTVMGKNPVMMLDLARNTILSALKESRFRCVNHILDLLRLCNQNPKSQGYDDLKLGVPEGVLEDVCLVNNILHDPKVYRDYLPESCSDQEIGVCYAEVSAVMQKTFTRAEAECTSNLVELMSRYRVIRRSDLIASLSAPSLAPGGGKKEIEIARESKVAFSC